MNKIMFSYKKVIIIYLIVFLIVTTLSFYFFINFVNTDDILLKKDLTCKFREKIKASEFITKIDGTLVKNNYIDTSEVGTSRVTIQYKNKYGIKVKKTFNVEVLDITKPTIIVNNPYIIEKGTILSLKDSIFCADDYDDYVDCQITGDYNLNKVGNYDLKITATDFSNNKEEKDFTLKIVEKNNTQTKDKTDNTYTDFKEIKEKYKKDNTLIGLDISKWQETVNYRRLKESGVEFVMIKIGGQTEINGLYIEDPRFKENIENAIANDIKVGVYFYSYAKNERDAKLQARWIVKKLRDYKINLPIAFDWENWNQYTTFQISFNTLNKIANTFIKEVEKNNYQGILYSSKYYLENIWYQENYTKWLAYYTKNNDYKEKYLIWQICNDGRIDGINGYVDIDIMNIKK